MSMGWAFESRCGATRLMKIEEDDSFDGIRNPPGGDTKLPAAIPPARNDYQFSAGD